ncbi:uncharacterized protein LOC119066667 [Bradysia coprophila]|uniref:uncharacterized protein LOC119066667 n=1 Tax=Bradysia coprophila TaxID=38358 RepID=UPI00187D9D23|nr:uncharacterized protein LOC119066667 [Bradysia coprophila]
MKIYIFIFAVAIFTGVIGSPIAETDLLEFLGGRIDETANIFIGLSEAIPESNPLNGILVDLGQLVSFIGNDVIDRTAGDFASQVSQTVDQVGSAVESVPVVGSIASGVVEAASPILKAVGGVN